MAFRSSSTTAGSGADLTASAPAGVVAGDRLVALFSQDNAGATFSVPAGWSTPVQQDIATPDSQSVAWSEKIATGSDSYAFSSSSSNSSVVHVLAFSGRHASTASTVSTVATSTSANSSPMSVGLNGLTAANGDDLAWLLGCDITTSGGTPTVSTPPTGFTARSGTASGLGAACTATQDAVSAGATGTLTGTVTLSAGTSGWVGWVLAIPAGDTSTVEQEGARFGVDDGDEASHTWAQAQDTNDTAAVGTARLIRLLLNATGDPASTAYTLRYQKNGAGGYVPVPVGSATSPTLSYGAAGTLAYSASGGTSVAPAYPTGITTNSGLVLVLGQKPSSANGGTATTPSGWTLQAELSGANDGDTGGYTTTLGADTGNTNIFVYTKDTVSGSESGTLSVTVGTNGVCWAQIIRLEASATATWSWAAATGKDTSAGSVSIATGSLGIAAGDMVIGGMVIPTDVTTPSQFSAESFTQSGTTFAGATEISEPDSTTGNDIGGFLCYDSASSGSGSGAVTLAATAGGTTTNVRGPGFVLRARVASVTNEIYVDASANIAAGGEATTARLTAPSGKSTSDFVTGRRWDDENGSDSIDVTTDDYTEVEWRVTTQSPAAGGDYYDFRVYRGSNAADTYTVTPRLTMSSSGAALAGTGSAPAAGAGTLTTRDALVGVGSATAAGSGAPTVRAALQGSGVASASGSGALSGGAVLVGTGLATASGAGTPTVRAALAGTGVETSSGIGSMAQPVTLAGSGAAIAAGSATLTARAALSSSTAESASGVATLAVPFRSPDLLGNFNPWRLKARFAAQEPGGAALAGTGQASAAGSAALTTRDALSGSGAATAGGAGALQVRAALAGGGAATSAGVGAINSGPVLSGSGSAASSGSGALTTRAVPAGLGDAQSSGTATLLTRAALAGVGSAAAGGVGTIGSGVAFAGTGVAGASSSATLQAQRAALAAIGTAQASSAAALRVVAALVGTGASTASGVLRVEPVVYSEDYRYDVPAGSLQYDVPGGSWRFDVPTIAP